MNLKQWGRIACSGLLVGAADIVPGISGGTVAFLLGIYEELLKSIATLKPSAFLLFFTGRWRLFFSTVAWQFLSSFLLGISVAFIFLAKTIGFLISHPTYKVVLLALFLGLVIGSLYFCVQHFRLTVKNLLFFAASTLLAFYLTSIGGIDIPEDTKRSSWWIISCGTIAVSAMLLPGISGSYMLQVFGMYSYVLSSLVDFIEGLKNCTIHTAAFFVLLCMGIGISLGALFFSRVVSYLLSSYKEPTMAVLTGFSFGALRVVWPFCKDGNIATMPAFDDPLLGVSIVAFILGISLVIGIEWVGKRKGKKNHLSHNLTK